MAGQVLKGSRSNGARTFAAREEHWMDVLKFPGEPSFDVIEMTKAYVEAGPGDNQQYLDPEYTFRGSVVGPITGQDVMETQESFDILTAYPDLQRNVFGYTVDPENPYRCFLFERWRGTFTGELSLFGLKLSPNQRAVECPMHTTSVVWNPEGKIIYESISGPLDRFEGNTKGVGAVFGLLKFAGVDAGGSVGDQSTIFQQKLFKAVGPVLGVPGKAFSDEDKIPKWWKSKARGAEPNDI